MSCDFHALANLGIQGLRPYQAGKPTDELERELGISNIVKLASNENPTGMSPKVSAAIEQAIAELTRYPDSNGFYLKQSLANKYQLAPEQFTLGNGSNDVLDLIARVFVSPEHEVVFSQHAFVVYPIVTQAIGAKAVVVPAKNWGHDLDAMAEAVTDNTRLVFIANPNNPTGTYLSSEALYDFMQKVPEHVVVVLDEAYYEYLSEDQQAPSTQWLSEFANLVITRTFSKAYGLAGLRVGYAISNPDIADLLNRLRQPFNVNSLSLVAAAAALQDQQYLQHSVALNQQGLATLEAFFEEAEISFIPSKGNFISFLAPGGDAEALYQQLLHKGVIVRPVGPYQMPGYLRVSIGTEQENHTFIQALSQLIGTK
ncbi:MULTISPECIES: histidinol-phosphate transaminase [unclassified Agarivorans]|uniref:histidinol-phosphate transaminase n=1 Tax=unclassified Agarivorans TaxID=2636026 RepID=UPI0026E2D603|nr:MULTISPECIES: histidinol-phosphate transaminase [unclassified Agarivorans]MDO6686202.1 histidinol-phosphate transaminase [Agarivorans sp. 3_MG-2023]MDO6716349.1 histidinol-phosphate transaminase [Agarivorans sp. 2_MG-2023]